ncbi:phage holin family protein [Clostridium niameyense]|uniref:Phage holin family protein n=1 Tax=Clostridium niameyense TaxID=1622073 RepID=A0A6M0R8J8_9CLOT|nr:phage holin family protein [Clostridium niameyense]NEZ46564.1 phage holin family protein [Clostridium niameyense]
MKEDNKTGSTIVNYLLRLILVAIILGITSFLTPGFSISGFWAFILAAIVITVIDYLVESIIKVDASPFGKGFKGFVISAIILYLTQFIVPTMKVSLIGAILASIVIGILDAILPGRAM